MQDKFGVKQPRSLLTHGLTRQWRRRMARLPRTVAWLETAWCVDVDRILFPCRTTDYYTFTATPGAPMIE